MRVLVAAVLAAFVAQTPGAPAARFVRPIAVAAPGPQRLAIDATLVAGGAPFTVVARGDTRQRLVAEGGLSDLRLTGPDGREVPYLLVHAPIQEPQWLPAAVLPIVPTSRTSGFEADLGSVRDVNGLELRRPFGPFMKRFMLEASADREHWTLVVADSTMFDVPERRLRHMQAGFSAGAYRYLRVTWDDTHSARVPVPSDVMVRLAGSDAAPAPPPLSVSLGIERRPSEPGRSRYHLTLPARHLPIVALRLDVGGTYVFRGVTVTEPRLTAWQAAPVAIGEGLLFRDRTPDPTLQVPIQPPSQGEIDLVVEDGNNPPLELHSVAAVFADMPWIYVDAPGPLVAHYGDTSLPRPSYDLEAARGTVQLDALPEAHWGGPGVVQAPAAAPAIDAAALGGGPIDVSPFRYSRALTPGEGPLQALPLDAAVLAHSAGPSRGFADVRIVDAAGRQVPRLVERRPEPLLIALRAQPASPVALELQPAAGAHRSIYRLDLPYPALPDASIVLTTSAPVFQRHITLGYERPPDRGHRDPWFLVARSIEWSRGEGASSSLTLAVPPAVRDATPLTLVVDEGDNSALPIAGVQLMLPSYRLRFVRPASASRVVYGSPTMDAPRYDLAFLAPSVLQAEAAEASMAAEAETPSAASEQLISPKMFWTILAVAVIALLGVLAALLRKPV